MIHSCRWRNRIACVVVIGVLDVLGSATARAQARPGGGAKPSITQDVVAASNRWYDAVSRGDATLLETIETDDFLSFQQLPQGLTVIPKKAQLENIRKTTAATRLVVHRTLENVKVRVYGDAAVLTAVATFRGTDAKGTPVAAQNLITEVWSNEDGKWKLGHFQSMAVPQKPPTPAK